MEIGRRHFKVEEGPVIERAKQIEAHNKICRENYSALLEKCGAEQQYYHRDGLLVGVIFPKGFLPDNKLWKRVKSGWYPKKNTKRAKLLWQEFNVIRPINEDELLKFMNLPRNGICFFANMKMYIGIVTVIPSDPPVVYMNIPWPEVDPEEVEKYRVAETPYRKRKEFLDFIINFEQPSWCTEVKSWELSKAIDEWNSSLKEEA